MTGPEWLQALVRGLLTPKLAPDTQLDYLTEIINEAERLRTSAVEACRSEGYSWAFIGRQMGVTKQAAQQRYAPTAPKAPDDPEQLRIV